MIVLEKKKDISILKSLGATKQMIRNIFIRLGMLLSGLGLAFGLIIGLTFYFLQTRFGIIGLHGSFIVDAYPIEIQWIDFAAVTVVVLLIGFHSVLLSGQRRFEVSTSGEGTIR